MTALEPCPFCGRDGLDLGEMDEGESWRVYCQCGALGPPGTEEGAVAAWNERADEAGD